MITCNEIIEKIITKTVPAKGIQQILTKTGDLLIFFFLYFTCCFIKYNDVTDSC